MKLKIKVITLLLLFIPWVIFAQEGFIESLKFKDADIRLVIQVVAEKAVRGGKKMNIIMTPEVQGLVSVDLENIEWEAAIKAVLRSSGYGYATHKDFIIVGSMEKIKETEAQELQMQALQTPQVRIFHLLYLDANDAKKAIEPILSKMGKISVMETTGQAGWEFGTDLTKRVRAKEGKLSRTNILIVSDIPKNLDEISSLIREIDVMPKQILIKSTIIEVNRDLLKDIGFDWGTGATGAESSTMYTTPSSKGSGVDETQIATHMLSPQPSVFGPKTTSLTADNAGLKFLFKRITGAQFEVVLHALEEDTRSNILSAPIILTLNNQEATILVGTKFPIIETDVSTESAQVIGGSLKEYKDIGIQLSVVPQICGENDDFINVILHPAVTSYTQTSKVTNAAGATLVEYPIIVSREAETQMLIKDGETVVMGGLLKDVNSKQEVGVPFLRKIPIIGFLFKRQTRDTEKIDLLIFITAKVITSEEGIPQDILNADKIKSAYEKRQ